MSRDRSGELPTFRTPPSSGDRRDARFVLSIVEGIDRGESCAIDAASPVRALVGKSPLCTLRLTDPEVSRRHASLRAIDRAVVVMDLSSTNGTWVNGVSVREAVLHGGEAIRIGRTVLSVARGAPSHTALTDEAAFGRMLGASRAMRVLYPGLQRLAATDRPCLIEGETGVGKELCAEEIHAHSPRAHRVFALLSPNALPADEIEARFVETAARARGGTLFVDEVGSLPPSLQAGVARELAQPPGAGPRFLFATRRDLDHEVAEGRFREDLLDAIGATRFELPPLRERDGDVGLLAAAFWRTLASASTEPPSPELPADFLPRFERYSWPGNVRELLRAVSVRFDLGEFASWRSAELRAHEGDIIGTVVDRELPLGEARQVVVDAFEARYVAHMLARHGNTRDAAQASGVALRYFQLLKARLEK